jgi:YbbR domain-containing protein
MAWHPFRNLWLKTLALGLSAVLWLTVTRDHVVERSLRVPLEYQNIPAELELTGEPPASVDVRIRGASSLLARLEPGEIVAVLDLHGARPGQRLFHLLADQVRAPFGVEVTQVAPPILSLTLERSGRRRVPVVPEIEGEPAPGFVVERVTADPPFVEVTGPESRLDAVREATTEPVSVQGATADVRDRVTIGVADAALRLSEARSATVVVEIVPAPIERSVKDVRVRVRNAGEGLRVSVRPAAVTVVLRGRREALGALDASRLEVFVDVASLGPGRYVLPARGEAGPDYGVVRTEPETVEVRIR